MGMRQFGKPRMLPLIAWLGLTTFLLGLSGCLIAYDPDGVELGTVDGTPKLIVTSPTEGESVETILRIRLEATNFSLVDPGGDNVETQGHVRIYIDGSPIVQGDPALTSVQLDVRVCSLATDHPEDHELLVVPYNNDETEHDVLSPITVTWTKSPSGC